MSITPQKERVVVFVAALLTIPASIVGVIYFLGVVTSLKFEWMHPVAPYAYSCITFAVLLWLTAFVMDYIAVRRAALAKPIAQIDPLPLIRAEEAERKRAVEGVAKDHCAYVQRTDQAILDLQSRPIEPTLKQRTIELANGLFELLRQQGPEPPDPLTERGTESQQRNLYFDWKKTIYYKYMAHFRNRVLQVDYELAALHILTKLEDDELDPPKIKCDTLNVKKIAEALHLVGTQMSN